MENVDLVVLRARGSTLPHEILTLKGEVDQLVVKLEQVKGEYGNFCSKLRLEAHALHPKESITILNDMIQERCETERMKLVMAVADVENKKGKHDEKDREYMMVKVLIRSIETEIKYHGG